jgi:DNA processing protein
MREMTDPPDKLYIEGNADLVKDQAKTYRGSDTSPPDIEELKFLCVVGSRKHSQYGKDACRELILGLQGYNICIVSGLAIGIDSIAHEAALEAGLPTIAFPGSGLSPEVLYPPRNQRLARRIVEANGALVSEFEMDLGAQDWCFPQRNRLMAGISHATLIIEAKDKSGTLITARLAKDYNRDILAVPGPIFSELSQGTNAYIAEGGAAMIRNSSDILLALGVKERPPEKIAEENRAVTLSKCTEEERRILDLLSTPMNKDELIHELDTAYNIKIQEANIILSMMELGGLIGEERGMVFAKKFTSV